jgi:hypothetical protein
MRPAASARCWRRRLCAAASLALASSAGAQVLDFTAALTANSDFGQPDIRVTAASIVQAGAANRARIDQTYAASADDAIIDPAGLGNIAAVSQNGNANQISVTQDGNLNRVRIVQTGDSNQASAGQSGAGNTLDAAQDGFGNMLLVTQTGVGNSIVLTQAGGNLATLNETGDHNAIQVQQVLGGATVTVDLRGNNLLFSVKQ